ncbi:MAG TPA: hypothetical protein VFC16_14505 [Nakamurella sp.]|nr:hypothetical protein [Nakamurella sp.]
MAAARNNDVPEATPITLAVTGDQPGRAAPRGATRRSPRRRDLQRVDIYAATLLSETSVDQVSDLDPSDTPPLGSPWDAVQIATQSWTGRPQGDTPRDS